MYIYNFFYKYTDYFYIPFYKIKSIIENHYNFETACQSDHFALEK